MLDEWTDKFRQLLLDQTSEGWNAAIKLKEDHLPRRIFKFFRPTEYALKNLEEGTVFLASPEDFNDPFDSGISMNVLPLLEHLVRTQEFEGLKDLEKIGLSRGDFADMLAGRVDEEVIARMAATESGSSPEALRALVELLPTLSQSVNQEMMVDRTHSFFRKALKVTSFTETANSPLLWAHYAENHKGFCVEYDPRSISPNLPQRRLLFPVLYDAKRFDAGPSFLKSMTSRGKDDLPNQAFLAALHKSPDWAYEREWRIVNPDGRENGFSVPMAEPTAVYGGVRMSEKDRNTLASLCSQVRVALRTPQLSADGYDIDLSGI